MKQKGGVLIKIIVGAVVFLLIFVVGLNWFNENTYIVQGPTMSPTYEAGDILWLEKEFSEKDIVRGSVVVFGYPKDPSKTMFKRVIGLPGDTVTIENGVVSITDQSGDTFVLDEPYVTNTKNDSSDNEIVTLSNLYSPNKEYYVLGDNRQASLDSRVWGPLPLKLIEAIVKE